MGRIVQLGSIMEKEFDVSYLSVDSVREGVGSSQISPLIFKLAEIGLKVCLITFEKNAPSLEMSDKYRAAGIHWVPKKFGEIGAIGGLKRLHVLRRSIPISKIVHGRSDIATCAAILNSEFASVLWDVRSLWSDQRLSIGTAGWNAMTARGARTLENICANRAVAMSTLTHAVVPILENRHKILPKIRDVVPTCVRTDVFKLTTMPRGQISCLISGTYNNYYDLERTREIILQLKKSIDIKVIWARPGESPNLTLGVGEDEIIEVEYASMPEIIGQSHFGIAICREDDQISLTAAVPTKVAEFLSIGRPMILSRGIGDLDNLIDNAKTGVIVGKNDSLIDIANRVVSLISDKETPDRCRKLAEDYFSFDTAIQKYLALYKKMIP